MNPWSKVNTGRNRPRKSSLDMLMTHIVWLLGTVTGCSVSGCCFSDSTRWRIKCKHIVAVLIHSITRWRIIPDYIMDRPGHTYDGAPSYSACPLYWSWWGRYPP